MLGNGAAQPALRVLLDGRLIRPFSTGIGRYIRELARALDRHSSLSVTVGCSVYGDAAHSWARSHGLDVYRLGDVRIPGVIPRWRFDVFHVTYPVIAPPLLSPPIVLTVHDLIHDDPRFAPLQKRAAFLIATQTMIWRAAVIVAVSEATALELRARRIGTRSVRVVGNGVSPEMLWAHPVAEPGEIYLYFGNARAHKGIRWLLEAVNRAGVQLTIATSDEGELAQLLKATESDLRYVGVVRNATDEVLQGLVDRAKAVIVPSAIEGFGIPAAEALARGRPVICSDIRALREVCQDSAVYVPFEDVSALEGALRMRIADEPADRRRRTALARARFNWCDKAEELIACYQLALA